jgi:hypothetical protein
MWTAPDARRRGHGARVLAWLEQAATERGYASLRLETGTEQPEAVALYQRAGYRRIAPYGPYRGDPRTICFEKLLAAPVDARGRLEEEPFGYRVTKDDRVLISFRGRQVTVVAGARGARLAGELEAAGGDASRVQMLLAKATGNFKHGDER